MLCLHYCNGWWMTSVMIQYTACLSALFGCELCAKVMKERLTLVRLLHTFCVIVPHIGLLSSCRLCVQNYCWQIIRLFVIWLWDWGVNHGVYSMSDRVDLRTVKWSYRLKDACEFKLRLKSRQQWGHHFSTFPGARLGFRNQYQESSWGQRSAGA
jgi:hypothetical protein